MKLLRHIFLLLCVILPIFGPANATISPDCEKYTDCDMLVACELTLQVENAINGLAIDYNGAVVNAVSYRNTCLSYPDKFKKNIDTIISEKPEVRLTIDWDAVRKRMRHGSQADFTQYDLDLVKAIVDSVFGPDTEAQKHFFEALTTSYIRAFKSDTSLFLDDAFVLDFLGTDDNFEKYRLAIRDLTGETVAELETEYGNMNIDVSWDDILIEVSNIMDKTHRKRGAVVCENNRSYQMGIDVAGWIITAVAAVATFYAGGAGGAAVAAGRAALGAGLKASAKGLAKVGAKGIAKKISKAGSKQLAKSAVKLGMKRNMAGWANYAGKGVLKGASKTFAKKVGANLTKKWTALAATSAAIWGLGTAASKSSTGSKFYSYLNSDLDKSFLNCQDLDNSEGCYSVCGDGPQDDYLNKYAFEPVLGKKYCVNPGDYALYELNPDGTRGNLMIVDANKQSEILSRIKQHVVDKGSGSLVKRGWGCDWNEDDIDMYFGFYIYDPDTLEITEEAMVIDDAIRLDD